MVSKKHPGIPKNPGLFHFKMSYKFLDCEFGILDVILRGWIYICQNNSVFIEKFLFILAKLNKYQNHLYL